MFTDILTVSDSLNYYSELDLGAGRHFLRKAPEHLGDGGNNGENGGWVVACSPNVGNRYWLCKNVTARDGDRTNIRPNRRKCANISAVSPA